MVPPLKLSGRANGVTDNSQSQVSMRQDDNDAAKVAALIMHANDRLSHSPPSSWNCWTAAGDEAAGTSSLALGHYGSAAVTGDFPQEPRSNALRVIDDHYFDVRSAPGRPSSCHRRSVGAA